jgi:hypothetical protein
MAGQIDAVRVVDDAIEDGVGASARGELLEQGSVETARGAVIDILHRGLMAKLGIAQAGKQAPVPSIADLVIEQQGEPFGMGQCRGFSGRFDLAEGFGHAFEPELMQQIESGIAFLTVVRALLE